jgi:Fic family protein
MVDNMNDFFEVHIGWIRQSNLIENVDDEVADRDSFDAWRMFTEQKKLTVKNILQCHEHIMWRLNKRIAGQLRKVNVRVGYRICPDYKRVPNLLNKWLNLYIRTENFETIREAHIVFERIHPFEDGNGRTGRMVMNWMLMKKGLDIFAWNFNDRENYYKWFAEKVKSWKGSIGDSQYEPSFVEMLASGRGWK